MNNPKVFGKCFSQLSKHELKRYIKKHKLPYPSKGSGKNERVLKRDLQIIASNHYTGKGIQYVSFSTLGQFIIRVGRISSTDIEWEDTWRASTIEKHRYSNGKTKLDPGLPNKILFGGYDKERKLHLEFDLPLDGHYCFLVITRPLK